MTKAIMSFAVGESHNKLLDLARPTFQAYAERHGYVYLEPQVTPCRPASWMKVTELFLALNTYDEVLWIDADAMIVDDSVDMADVVPAEAWQAMVIHNYGDRTNENAFADINGNIPNCGVWFVRKPMMPILSKLWGMKQYTDHTWWEQAAMHELLGFGSECEDLIPVRHLRETDLYHRTHFLPLEWNSDEFFLKADNPRIVHVPGVAHEWRLGVMRGYAERIERGDLTYVP